MNKHINEKKREEGNVEVFQTPDALKMIQSKSNLKEGAKYIDYINGVPIEAYI